MTDINFNDIDAIISNAIDHHLGNIEVLPEIAQSKIRRVYKTFFKAYLKIAKLKRISMSAGQCNGIDLDSEVIEYMQHFFSDYQDIYREFNALNRHARALMQIDRQKNAVRFEAQLNALLSGQDDSNSETVLENLINASGS